MKQKEPKVIEVVDQLAKSIFGRSTSEALKNKTCVNCGKKVDKFRDELSKKEYEISALCQKCQDGIWGDSEEIKVKVGKSIIRGEI